MNLCNFKPLVAAALVATSLGAVSARAEGVYLGGSLGAPQYQDNENGITGKGSGVSGKLFAGYQVSPNFALEVGVADLGHIDNATGTVNGHGEYLDAVGLLPLNSQWALFGSAGMTHVNLDTSNGDGSGNGLKLGLGAEYSLTSKVALRGEWERYRPDVFNDTPNIDQYTVGLRAAF